MIENNGVKTTVLADYYQWYILKNSPSYYLPIAGGRIRGFIPFPSIAFQLDDVLRWYDHLFLVAYLDDSFQAKMLLLA